MLKDGQTDIRTDIWNYRVTSLLKIQQAKLISFSFEQESEIIVFKTLVCQIQIFITKCPLKTKKIYKISIFEVNFVVSPHYSASIYFIVIKLSFNFDYIIFYIKL